MLLGEELAIDVASRDEIVGINGESGVSNLNRQAVFEIQEADLADVFQLAASLANLRLLVPGVAAGPPPKYRERAAANLALLVVFGSCHPDIGVVAEA